MDDLIAFVAARLDEDEAAANEIHRPRDCGSVDRDGEFSPDPVWCSCDYPARVLREVEAKRAILGWHHPEWGDYVDGDGIERATHECAECEPPGTPDNWPCRTVRALAAIWRDHPGYRPEWKP